MALDSRIKGTYCTGSLSFYWKPPDDKEQRCTDVTKTGTRLVEGLKGASVVEFHGAETFGHAHIEGEGTPKENMDGNYRERKRPNTSELHRGTVGGGIRV